VTFRARTALSGTARARGARWRARCALALSAVLAAGTAIAGSAPAAAAGAAQLQVVARAIDPGSGEPVTSMSPGPNGEKKVAYRVDFSCLVADCDGAVVRFAPTQLDPNHDYYRLLLQSGFTPPVSGGSISGSATEGYTVDLGDLSAGESGSFTVEYSLPPITSRHVSWRDGEFNGWAVSNFPDGFPIVQQVTGDAATVSAPSTMATEPVIWQNDVPEPSIAQWNHPAKATTDTDYTYKLYMASGCTFEEWNGAWGSIVAPNSSLCAEKYQVDHRLPPGVELVSASNEPTVSGAVATGLVLTWKRDATDWKPRSNAEAGWNSSTAHWSEHGSSPRSVTVRFPSSNFAPAGSSCDFDATAERWTTDLSVTYISSPGEEGVTKKVSTSTDPTNVRCGRGSPPANPFGKAVGDAKVSTFDGAVRLPNGDSPIRVPARGAPDNEKEWQVTVGNQANIEGVAVVTDDKLDLPDAPVYRIETTPAGAKVDWTATDGSRTVTGSGTAPLDAPAGFRFASAVVTSPELEGPNTASDQSARTDFTVAYKYRVASTAPPGERRTNSASARMTFPRFPAVADVPLKIASHTIQFATPFGKATAFKALSPGTLVDGAYELPVPVDGGRSASWFFDVKNQANVPGVATVEESDLRGAGGAPVTRITPQYRDETGWKGIATTVEYALDNGDKGTAHLAAGQSFDAPGGRSIVSARVISDPLAGRNSTPDRADEVIFRVSFAFSIVPGLPTGVTTNSAKVTMSYPGYPEVEDIAFDLTAKARLIDSPAMITATLTRQLPGGATTAGPAVPVTFVVSGSTSGVTASRDFTPQYAFVAPADWAIEPGSAKFPTGSVPPGVQFDYREVTIGGEKRQAVVATWPAGVVFGKNTTLPAMSVIARPGVDVPHGTVGIPEGYVGNSAQVQAADVFETPFVDSPDLDADGDRDERFATASNTAARTTVTLQPGLRVLKEICLPDDTAADGCSWIADPDNPVGVAPNSTSISYRLSITNVGNSTLSDVVGYDVLPYIGDTGTSDPTGSTPRGSNFRMSLQSVTTPTNGSELAFSDGTQPCRPEVDATVPGCADDWDGNPDGAQAIRFTRSGEFRPGERMSVEYTAAVNDAPANGAIACNSFAVMVTGLDTVNEPSPVCATIEDTDLGITAGTPNLQQGRPGVLPLTVTNHGDAASAMGRVDVSIPAGLMVTDFAPAGWTCTAVDGAGDPVFGSAIGPATLTCRATAAFVKDVPVALDIPVIATTSSVAVDAKVTGQIYDRDLSNNQVRLSAEAAGAGSQIGVTKDDGVTQASPGEELTYTITVRNPLVYEALPGATLSDALPAGTRFVSASDGGAASGATVTWSLPEMPPAGSLTRTVTVRVLPSVAADLVNVASASAPDPTPGAGTTLTGSGQDRDRVVTRPKIAVTKTALQPDFAAPGETIDYWFTIENTGDVELTNVGLSDPLKGLSDIVIDWPGAKPSLAPGEKVTASATYPTTQGDVDAAEIVNTAEANGRAPDGVTVTAKATHTIPGTAVAHLSLEKSAAGTPKAAGDIITYTFTLVNDGGRTLHDVAVVDELPGLSSLKYDWPGTAAVLAPGQRATATATYSVRQADVDAGRVENTATASGVPHVGPGVSTEDSATLAIDRVPGITLTKQVAHEEGTRGAAGDRLLYTFTIRNTGNVTLSNVAIDDKLSGLTPLRYTWPGSSDSLLPGQVATANAEYTIRQEDVDDQNGVINNATVTAHDPTRATVTDSATATATTSAEAQIEIAGTGVLDSKEAPRAGDIVRFTFVTTNLGDLTLSGVAVAVSEGAPTSRDGSSVAWPETEGVLRPLAAQTTTVDHELTQAEIDAGFVERSAAASGSTRDGRKVNDDETVTVVLRAAPAIALTKTATRSGSVLGAAVGDTVTYTLTATNRGNVTLHDVRIADGMQGLSPLAYDWPGDPGSLAPGDTVNATATYAITADDLAAGSVLNTATVTSDRGAKDEASVTLTTPPILAPPAVGRLIDAVAGLLADTGTRLSVGGIAALVALGTGLAFLLLRRRRGQGENVKS